MPNSEPYSDLNFPFLIGSWRWMRTHGVSRVVSDESSIRAEIIGPSITATPIKSLASAQNATCLGRAEREKWSRALIIGNTTLWYPSDPDIPSPELFRTHFESVDALAGGFIRNG